MRKIQMRFRAVAICCFCLCAFAHAQQENKVKIICYNILEGMVTDTSPNKQVFAKWVEFQNPDILALQETNNFTQDKLEDLAHSYGHPYAILSKEPGYPPSLTAKKPILNAVKLVDNLWHACVIAEVDGYHIISLHLSPHQYVSRGLDIELILQTIRSKGDFKKWIIMGDFNSISPLDKDKYADGKYTDRMKEHEDKNPTHHNLVSGQLDYSVHQRILDFGFVDAIKQAPDYSSKAYDRRIDFIYVSPDLKDKIQSAGFITDDFTKVYSDHKPIFVILGK